MVKHYRRHLQSNFLWYKPCMHHLLLSNKHVAKPGGKKQDTRVEFYAYFYGDGNMSSDPPF
jgi:hypothetical protein